ncbi:hypothetical protein [Streptomyces decoyicus]|uniref:hypothetical protein n=1 Tax=Streptomyces decoyicus TaxID=249567 RepID=UPI0036669584
MRYTADGDGPYELTTDEGLLWTPRVRAPHFEHRTGALALTVNSYSAELSVLAVLTLPPPPPHAH